MYLRTVHAEDDIPTLQQLIRDNPLGILTTAIKSPIYPFIQSSHIPFLIDVPSSTTDDSSAGTTNIPKGILRGHIARSNPQAKAIIDALEAKRASSPPSQNTTSQYKGEDVSEEAKDHYFLDDEVLVLFTSPYNHYVTPHFYTSTKPDTGKVVPTWNYAAVQAYGRARVYYYPSLSHLSNSSSTSGTADEGSEVREDEREIEKTRTDTDRFLQKQIEDLTQFAEMGIMGYHPKGEGNRQGQVGKEEWKVSDAPSRYVDLLKKNIIGIEIRVDRLEGKFKMTQEMGTGDREGVIAGMRMLETPVSDGVAKLVEERGRMKDQK